MLFRLSFILGKRQFSVLLKAECTIEGGGGGGGLLIVDWVLLLLLLLDG